MNTRINPGRAYSSTRGARMSHFEGEGDTWTHEHRLQEGEEEEEQEEEEEDLDLRSAVLRCRRASQEARLRPLSSSLFLFHLPTPLRR
jgi:hypothetical protein